jgi:sortase (surface protein transpeptidase)
MARRSFLPRVVVAAAIATALIVDSGPVLAMAPTAIAPVAVQQPVASRGASAVHVAVGDRDPGRSPRVSASTSVPRDSISRATVRQQARESHQLANAVGRPKPARSTPAPTAHVSYRGRNHLWIPALGINRSTVYFSCSSSGVGNYVYRWGCAGSNNVYLFGHAFSVFRPLHDAYVSGRLYRGMRAIYADASGHVHSYRVAFWKVVSPTNGGWAYAAQSRPSMTLQTCVGSRSQYRLIVRLIAV